MIFEGTLVNSMVSRPWDLPQCNFFGRFVFQNRVWKAIDLNTMVELIVEIALFQPSLGTSVASLGYHAFLVWAIMTYNMFSGK
jgi:hypothetical protein